MKPKAKAKGRRRIARQARSAYRSPKLVAYGDVRQLTDSGTNMFTQDGYSGAMFTKT